MTRREAFALSLAGIALYPSRAGPPRSRSPQVPLPRSVLPKRETLGRLGLERAWYTAVPLGTGSEVVQSVNLAEDMLFVQTDQANLHAYEAETGKYLWGTSLGRETLDAQPVSLNSDQAFVADGPYMNALDRRTGTSIWRVRMEATGVGATAATETEVVVGLANRKIAAFNARDMTQTKPPGRSAGSFDWTWQTQGKITARPVPAGRVVAFASHDGKVYVALDDPPAILYRYLTGGPIIGSLGTVGTSTLVVPSMDRTLYGIGLFRGDTKWTVATGAPLDEEPLVAGTTVYVLNTGGRLLAVDGESGAIQWSTATGGGRLLAIGGSRIYVISRDGDLAMGDRSSGRLVASPRETRERMGLDLRDFRFALTNHVNDRLYFATKSGFLLVLREAGQTLPRPLRPAGSPKFGTVVPDSPLPTATPPDAPTEETPAAEKPEGGEEKPKN